MSVNKMELAAIDAFLESPWGTPEMHEALDELIHMAEVTRKAIADKAAAAAKRGVGGR